MVARAKWAWLRFPTWQPCHSISESRHEIVQLDSTAARVHGICKLRSFHRRTKVAVEGMMLYCQEPVEVAPKYAKQIRSVLREWAGTGKQETQVCEYENANTNANWTKLPYGQIKTLRNAKFATNPNSAEWDISRVRSANNEGSWYPRWKMKLEWKRPRNDKKVQIQR